MILIFHHLIWISIKKKKTNDYYNFFIIEYNTFKNLKMNENDLLHLFKGELSLGYDILLYKPTKSIIILVKCYFMLFKV